MHICIGLTPYPLTLTRNSYSTLTPRRRLACFAAGFAGQTRSNTVQKNTGERTNTSASRYSHIASVCASNNSLAIFAVFLFPG